MRYKYFCIETIFKRIIEIIVPVPKWLRYGPPTDKAEQELCN